MASQRFIDRVAELERALERLNECDVPDADAFMRDATIQRFEFTFELLWKSMKVYMEEQGLDAATPRQTFRGAHAAKLFPTTKDAEAWSSMLDDRNRSSHTYHEALALRIYGRILSKHLPLIRAMTARLKELAG